MNSRAGLGGPQYPSWLKAYAQDQPGGDLSIWLKPHNGNIPSWRGNTTMELGDLSGERYVLLEGKLEE